MESKVDILNNGITEALKALDVKTYGVAEPVVIRDSQEVIIPAIVANNGECFNVFEDADDFDIVCYHRLNSKVYSSQKPAYGSDLLSTATYDMSLFVVGRRRFSPYEAERVVVEQINKQKDLVAVETNFNAVQIFATEFNGLPYLLSPEMFFFKTNYRITRALHVCK